MQIVVILLLVALANCKTFENLVIDTIEETRQEEGKHWALLVAGSYGYYNYRHQADVCHAFQVLKRHGIPEENIVVMMYDDIANSPSNPTKGIIINHPEGSDVYQGVPKDYTKKDVNPKNFLNILQGNEEAMQGIGSGKVIKSGPNDHVFVNFVDHGGPNIVAFPHEMLHAKKWNDAIKQMHEDNKYKQMVIYLEACESGSMFNKLLPKDINVFATTASSPTQSSYACYYDKKRHTYLGDVYSVKWMEDSDKEDLSQETLQKQYKIVKKETNTSIVEEYGDKSIADEMVAEFQGDPSFLEANSIPKIIYPDVPLDAVSSHDVPLAILHHRLADAQSEQEEEEVLQEIRKVSDEHSAIEQKVKDIVTTTVNHNHNAVSRILGYRTELNAFDCYQPVVDFFDQRCFNVAENDYAMRHLYVFVNLCEEKYPVSTIISAMEKVCN